MYPQPQVTPLLAVTVLARNTGNSRNDLCGRDRAEKDSLHGVSEQAGQWQNRVVVDDATSDEEVCAARWQKSSQEALKTKVAPLGPLEQGLPGLGSSRPLMYRDHWVWDLQDHWFQLLRSPELGPLV